MAVINPFHELVGSVEDPNLGNIPTVFVHHGCSPFWIIRYNSGGDITSSVDLACSTLQCIINGITSGICVEIIVTVIISEAASSLGDNLTLLASIRVVSALKSYIDILSHACTMCTYLEFGDTASRTAAFSRVIMSSSEIWIGDAESA
jgi:hypothetical protein